MEGYLIEWLISVTFDFISTARHIVCSNIICVISTYVYNVVCALIFISNIFVIINVITCMHVCIQYIQYSTMN